VNANDTAWHVATNGAERGPLTFENLVREISEGKITADTLVWCPGWPDWARAGDVEGLFQPPPVRQRHIEPAERPAPEVKQIATETTTRTADALPRRVKWIVWNPKTEAEARNGIAGGVAAGYVFSGMYAIGALITYWIGIDITTRSKLTDPDEVLSNTIAAAAIAGLIAGLAYWLHRKPNVIVPFLLLVWFVVEIFVKLANYTGGTNAGWWLMYAFVFGGFVSSIRGALFLKRLKRDGGAKWVDLN
jgi:hypothetical protein